MAYSAELKEILDIALKEGASDVHFSVGRAPSIRVSGFLIPLLKKSPLTSENTKSFLEGLVSKEDFQRFLHDKEIDFADSLPNGGRFRGNAFIQQSFVSIALRFIPEKIKTLAELNLPTSLEQFTDKPQGFFLVVGPVGHGKTTTLAALIDLINRKRAEHIITIEDPVEYIFKPDKSIIDQREVGLDTNDFKTALIEMFRQDVDVVMIGEMRGPETISTAVTAGETGHLIFSTLHTNNASQTIDRIIDTFPPQSQDQIRMELSVSLTGIFSQRLIPRIAGGLVPAYELLINNNAISNLIREKRTHEINTAIETGLDYGMIDLNRSLAELVRAGEITPENAYLYSLKPKGLDRLI